MQMIMNTVRLILLVRNVFDIWQETSKDRLTQMIFSDLGTPGGKSFNLYQDIKDKLINLGVPEDEVAFIHDVEYGQSKGSAIS